MLPESNRPCSGDSRTAPAEPQSLGELVDATGQSKIELLCYPDEGSGPTLQLVEYSWGSGLGWYPRKRLTLDAEQGAGLAALLSAALTPARPAVRPSKLPLCRPAVEQDGNVIRLLFPTAPAAGGRS